MQPFQTITSVRALNRIWKSAVQAAMETAMHMGKKMRVMIGMSGGVDSSVAALLLKQSGADVAGVTLVLTDGDDGTNAKDAKEIAGAIGIPHFVADMRADFKKYVTDFFVREYNHGRTPNPCIVCNRTIKFGKMLEFAEKNGYDYIATGHYAKVERNAGSGLYSLKKASYLEKDQTYFLYTLTQERLSKIIMPLGGYTKAQVRDLAEKSGFTNAKKQDSQDICFIPDGDKNRYLKQFLNEKPGPFVDVNGNVLGMHKGIFHYTVGQRKGLGIAFGKPMFVLSVNARDNTVVLGEAESAFSDMFYVQDCNFLPFPAAPDGFECMCKVRYSAQEVACRLTRTENGYCVHLFSPVRAVTPGQAAVFYSGDELVGGGTILTECK